MSKTVPNQMRATVTEEFRTKRVYVEIGFMSHEGQLDRTLLHWIIPFQDHKHAWAVADAYNHPESNSNTWRLLGNADEDESEATK